MDVKELNKPQLILLAILLSFITSIVTGITTVALMEQAPASVTTPINRIIRQTEQKIVQVEGKTSERTIVVKEEDLVVDAIAKNQSALFTISKEILTSEGNMTEVSAGRGFAISSDGVVVVDGALVPGEGVYYVKNDGGKFRAKFAYSDPNGFSFLQAGDPIDKSNKLVFTVSSFGDLSKMKAGQKIIVLGSSISSFIFDGNKDIKMNVTKSGGGGIVLDLDGNVIGVALSGDTASFAPIDSIVSALKTLDKSKPATTPTQ